MIRTIGARGLLAAVAVTGGAARADEAVAVFFYGPPPDGARIQALATDASSVRRTDDGPRARVTVSWPDVIVTFTMDPAWPRDVQLAGIRGWIDRFPADETRSPQVKRFLADLDGVTTCWGTVVAPALDADGTAVRLLSGLMGPAGGFFFSSGQAFYGADGARIIGLPGAPPELARATREAPAPRPR